MTADRTTGPRWVAGLRTVLVVLAGLWLASRIIVAGVAAVAAQSSDARLLSAMGTTSHPEAAAILAEAKLAGGDRAGAFRLAAAVVHVDPTNVRALRVLGMATIGLGHAAAGNAMMRQAGMLGWRDTPTQFWVLRDAALRGDTLTLIERTDALARRNAGGALPQAIFLTAITDPRARVVVADRLGENPPWRGAFFAAVRQSLPATATAAMEALFRDMRARGERIGPIEWLSYVDRLIDLGQFQHARQVWAQAFDVPATRLAEMPYDGMFRAAAARPTDAPVSQFEWSFDPDLASPLTGDTDHAAVAIAPDGAGGKTLAAQLLVLAPGKHVLTARIDGPAALAAATWGFACLPSKAVLPRQFPAGTRDELSSVTIDVPTQGCDAERLSLTTIDKADGQQVTLSDVRIR